MNRRKIPKSNLLSDKPLSDLPKVPELSYIKDLLNKADKVIEKISNLLD